MGDMADYKLVPEKKPLPALFMATYHEAIGWNACVDAMLAAAPNMQEGSVGFCEDTALSLAERTFSTEIDEQLASDIIQYASRLHSRYMANQQPTSCVGCEGAPVPDNSPCSVCGQKSTSDVSVLIEALEELVDLMEDTRQGEYIPDSFTTQPARIALEAYRKQCGEL